MSKSQFSCDRRILGWLAAGVLSGLLTVPAWGLELDHEQEIKRKDAESMQILGTLGRRRSGATVAKADKEDSDLKVKMIASPKAR